MYLFDIHSCLWPQHLAQCLVMGWFRVEQDWQVHLSSSSISESVSPSPSYSSPPSAPGSSSPVTWSGTVSVTNTMTKFLFFSKTFDSFLLNHWPYKNKNKNKNIVFPQNNAYNCTYIHTYIHTYRQTDRQTHNTHTYTQTDRQTDRHIHTHTHTHPSIQLYRQTQTDGWTHTHTHTHIHTYNIIYSEGCTSENQGQWLSKYCSCVLKTWA